MSSDHPDGREWRDLLLRLIDGIKEDIGALREGQGDIDKIARDAYNKLGEIERRMSDVEKLSNAATISLAEIKSVASVWGAGLGSICGVIGSIVVAWLLAVLKLK